MVIFSHRGIGFGKKENSLEAAQAAVSCGVSVELDLRLKNEKVILAHDETRDALTYDNFEEALPLVKENGGVYFAFHLKEDNQTLFKKASTSIRPYKNVFLFTTDFPQDNFLKVATPLLDKSQLALYVTDERIDPRLIEKVGFLWLDETSKKIYANLAYFIRLGKKVICCSPELFMKEYQGSLAVFKIMNKQYGNDLFGICTDFVQQQLREPICPVCNSQGPFERLEEVQGYIILRCPACHLEFASSMRYELSYYEEVHYAQDYNLDEIKALSREHFLKKALTLSYYYGWQPHQTVLNWLENNLKKGSTVLDIGCGTGWFIAALEARGYKVVGIEVSTTVVSMLRDKGFQVYLGPLEKLEAKEFPVPDLVVLFGVIEHVRDPVALLKDIGRKFPRAMLLVSIPSPKRWDFAIGLRNYWDYPPNHLTPVWPKGALEIAVKRAGFLFHEWLFPTVTEDEVWFVSLDQVLTKLNLRRRGYFVGLTNQAVKNAHPLALLVRVLYPLFQLANTVCRWISWPLLHIKCKRFNKRGFLGLSAVAVGLPEVIAKEKNLECPACGAKDSFIFVEAVNNLEMVRCSYCGLEFVKTMQYTAKYYELLYYNATPALKKIERLSRQDYMNLGKKLLRDRGWQPYHSALQWIIENCKAGDTIFDIGCGAGWMLAALEAGGFKPIGMEVSEKIISLLKSDGFDIYRGPLEKIPEDAVNPDAVTAFEVIEHVAHPRELLTLIRKRFSRIPLIMSVPTPLSWTIKLGIRSYCDYPPNHLTRWTEESLKAVLRRAGYNSITFFYPLIPPKEIFSGLFIWLTYKLGMRKKGYFGEIQGVDGIAKRQSVFSFLTRLCYPLLDKIFACVAFLFLPFGQLISIALNKRGYKSFCSVVIAKV